MDGRRCPDGSAPGKTGDLPDQFKGPVPGKQKTAAAKQNESCPDIRQE